MFESLPWLHAGSTTGYVYLTETKSTDNFFTQHSALHILQAG